MPWINQPTKVGYWWCQSKKQKHPVLWLVTTYNNKLVASDGSLCWSFSEFPKGKLWHEAIVPTEFHYVYPDKTGWWWNRDGRIWEKDKYGIITDGWNEMTKIDALASNMMFAPAIPPPFVTGE